MNEVYQKVKSLIQEVKQTRGKKYKTRNIKIYSIKYKSKMVSK